MSEPGWPAAWYADPHSPSLRRWWDGRTWTEHTLLSSADPKLTAAAEPRSPASIVSSSLTAEAYGTRLVFDGRTLTVQATSFLARVALGATSRTVQASETTALDLSTPGATKIGTFTVGTITGKMLIRYSGKQASGVTTIYNTLSEAATRELIRAARTFDGLSASEAEREGFNLGKGEKLYGIVEGAHLVEIKHARGYRPQAGSGTRFRITKGISVGAGGGCSLFPRPGAPTTIDEGSGSHYERAHHVPWPEAVSGVGLRKAHGRGPPSRLQLDGTTRGQPAGNLGAGIPLRSSRAGPVSDAAGGS
jgi:hypothetical protein